MKRGILAMLSILSGSVLMGAPLSPEQALERASGHTPSQLASQTTAKYTLTKTVNTMSGTPAVYIFNTPRNGFMLLSADDTAAPILGYGEGTIDPDNMPANMQSWLSQYAAEIEYAVQNEGVQYVYESVGSSGKTPIEPLCKTKWNQGDPYNAQCPVINNNRCVTGCVATAMAQVMKYHNYPEQGNGSITYTDSYKNTYTMNFDQKFEWDKMLDSYTAGSYTSEQGNAVAYLMKSCGYSVKMNYSPNESGAVTLYMADALPTYFGYDSNCKYIQRNYYGLNEWIEKAYDNLKNVGPIIYSGQGGGGGHCFVVDGYSGNNFFHINWGWGGTSDGYYLLTACNPSSLGIGGGNGGYNTDQGMIIGIQPPKEGTTLEYEPLTQTGNLACTLDGTSIEFSVNATSGKGGFFNSNKETINGALGMFIENAEGEESYINRYTIKDLPSGYGYPSYDVTLPGNLDDGIYKIYPACKISGYNNEDPMHMLAPVSAIRYAVLTVTDGAYSLSMPSSDIKISINSVEYQSELYSGRNFIIKAKVQNDGTVEAMTSINLGLAPVSDPTNITYTGGSIQIDILEGESTDILYNSIFQANGSAAPAGDYKLYLYYGNTGEVLYWKDVTLKANPGAASISCTKFSMEGNPSKVDGPDLTFNIGLSCSSGYFTNTVGISFFNSEGTWMGTKSVQEPTYLGAGQSLDIKYTVNFAEGEVGKNYIARLDYLNEYFWRPITDNIINFTIASMETGITNTISDEGPVEYYDMEGNRVTEPQPGKIYIRISEGKSSKILNTQR